jgi:methylated-DNA-[protein]-cysteine S-methyltransferase
MSKVRVFTVETWLGPIYGAVNERGLCALSIPSHDVRHFAELLDRRCPGAEAETVEPREVEAGRQLAAYFARKERALDAPVDLEGFTPFARTVMECLRQVPYGQTVTYGELAARAGRPGAARAVGQVMHSNPVPLFLPCHRVLGASGDLTGFAGGLDTKKALLEMESGGLPFPPPNQRRGKGQSRGGSR